MPEERGVRPLEAKLHGLIIQLADALHAVSKLQTVEVGEAAAVDVVPRMVAVKKIRPKVKMTSSALKSRVGGKPRRALKRDVAAQMKAVGSAVIENFPALRQLGDQPVGIGIDVKQTIVDLSGQRIDNQAAADFLRIKGINLAADAIDETAIADIGAVGERRGGKSWPTQQGNGCQEMTISGAYFLFDYRAELYLIKINRHSPPPSTSLRDNAVTGCV